MGRNISWHSDAKKNSPIDIDTELFANEDKIVITIGEADDDIPLFLSRRDAELLLFELDRAITEKALREQKASQEASVNE